MFEVHTLVARILLGEVVLGLHTIATLLNEIFGRRARNTHLARVVAIALEVLSEHDVFSVDRVLADMRKKEECQRAGENAKGRGDEEWVLTGFDLRSSQQECLIRHSQGGTNGITCSIFGLEST